MTADLDFPSRAGILGLTSALQLQNALGRDSSILIVARDWPSDESIHYTSPWAGAHGRHIPAETPLQIQHERFMRLTDAVLQAQATDPASGVEFMDGYDFLAKPSSAYIHRRGGYGNSAEFRLLGQSELPVNMGITFGAKYRTWCLNPPVYCAYLHRRFLLRGGKTIKKTLTCAEEAFTVAANVSVVVNCSGFGFGDPNMFPIRGGFHIRLSAALFDHILI